MVMSQAEVRRQRRLAEKAARGEFIKMVEPSEKKKQHFIQEPYGLPRELQEKDKFYTEEEEKTGVYSKDKYWIHKDKSWDIKPCKKHPFDIKSKMKRRF